MLLTQMSHVRCHAGSKPIVHSLQKHTLRIFILFYPALPCVFATNTRLVLAVVVELLVLLPVKLRSDRVHAMYDSGDYLSVCCRRVLYRWYSEDT
jgi:hypothetical protein